MPNLQRTLLGLVFIVAGALHFKYPRMYEAIVPSYLPAHEELVAISGICEILGGAGVFVPGARVTAGWGLIALLLAVFPANLNMALESEKFASVAPAWTLYARLPLQALLIWWVYGATIRKK